MKSWKPDTVGQSVGCVEQGALLRQFISTFRRHVAPDKRVEMHFMGFAFRRLQWLAGSDAEMWNKSTGRLKHVQTDIEHLPSQESMLFNVLSEMRDNSSTHYLLLPGLSKSGGITPIGLRRGRKAYTKEVLLNGYSHGVLEPRLPVERSA